MATFEVDELFPGATIEGMDTAPGFNAIPGSSESIRSVHVYTYQDGAPPELEALMRKGFGRTARMGRLKTTLTVVPEGVRAQGSFGPDLGRASCVVVFALLFALVVGGYLVITRHRVSDFIVTGAAIVGLFFVGRLGRLLGGVTDDWNERDLASLKRVLHRTYDGASSPGVPGARDGAIRCE